jgi:hypothetical protein
MKTIFIVIYQHDKSGKQFVSGVNFDSFYEALNSAKHCTENVSVVNIVSFKIDLYENLPKKQPL